MSWAMAGSGRRQMNGSLDDSGGWIDFGDFSVKWDGWNVYVVGDIFGIGMTDLMGKEAGLFGGGLEMLCYRPSFLDYMYVCLIYIYGIVEGKPGIKKGGGWKHNGLKTPGWKLTEGG
ncbi:hypothetical protein RHGRI_020806 [Rhododendron griersonianum]|uniref:Uncharacterized protein n=1 Tax=Rhododendron griersonianum TaxID=479676 RepID=A0AAV6JHL7_9ERIC|nr:hypothetical protein RHGRI_020806 [Rhododendron griersonianum]